jgi:hypothetical protein
MMKVEIDDKLMKRPKKTDGDTFKQMHSKLVEIYGEINK